MTIDLVHIEGQTLRDSDEMAGLKPEHITTHAQLNQWEEHNIVKWQRWAMRQMKRDLLEEGLVRDVNKCMLADTWMWLGTIRQTDKYLGLLCEIAVGFHQLLNNSTAQI